MIKQFFKDSFIYSIAGFLSRGISLILLPVYTRIFSTAEYGLIDYITVMGGVAAVTVALEVSQGMARYYAEAKDSEDKHTYGSTALWFTIFTYLIFLLGVIAFKNQLTEAVFGIEVNPWLSVLAVTLYAVSGILYTIQNQLRWDLKAMLNAKVSLVVTFGNILFTLLFVVWFNLGVQGAIQAQIVTAVLSSLFGFYLNSNAFRFRFSVKHLKQMLWFSLPLVPSSLGVVTALYVDRLAVKQLLSLSELGVFGVGYRIASVIGLLMMGFQSALTPLVYANYKDDKTAKSLASIFRLFVVFALLFFAGLSLFASDVIRLLTPNAYHEAAYIVPPLVLGVLLWQMYVFAPGLGIARKTWTIGLLNIGSALLNLALNYVLIPYWGILGAAMATFVSAICIFFLYMILSQKYYFVPHEWSKILLATLLTFVIVYAVILCLDGLVVKTIALAGIIYLLLKIKLVEPQEILIIKGKVLAMVAPIVSRFKR